MPGLNRLGIFLLNGEEDGVFAINIRTDGHQVLFRISLERLSLSGGIDLMATVC